MEIVINISDSIYKDLQLGIGGGVVLKLEDIVVLPKGHGRLIDEQDAIDTLSVMFSGNDEILNDALECIEQLPEVIKVDGGAE